MGLLIVFLNNSTLFTIILLVFRKRKEVLNPLQTIHSMQKISKINVLLQMYKIFVNYNR